MKTREANPTFTLFKNNNVDGKYKVFASDLRQSFYRYLNARGRAWVESTPSELVARCFLAESLSSTYDNSEFAKMYPLFKLELDIFWGKKLRGHENRL